MQANHFPLRRSLVFSKSVYEHRAPNSYAGFFRRKGLEAHVEGSQVIVYHAGEVDPDDQRSPCQQMRLTATDHWPIFIRAVNAHVGFALKNAGFLGLRKRGRKEYISPDRHVVSLAGQERGRRLPSVSVGAHLRWTWDVERHGGRVWLVPLPGRCFLTCCRMSSGGMQPWLLERLRNKEPVKGIDLSSGLHRDLDCQEGRWIYRDRDGWKAAAEGDWRVTLDMRDLYELGYSEQACHAAQFSFSEMLKAIHSCSPFGQLVEALEPIQWPKGFFGTIGGKRLQFKRGLGRNLKEVLQLGILEQPPSPVSLAVVRSHKSSSEERQARQILEAHLARRQTLKGEYGKTVLESVGAGNRSDTISTIWTTSEKYGSKRGLGLPPFQMIREEYYYDRSRGCLENRGQLLATVEREQSQGRQVIALVLVDDDMPPPLHDALMREFSGIKALPLNPSSLTAAKGYPSWVNLTLMLAQKAGAVPWELAQLPGIDENTVMLGMDLGHSHQQNQSRLALTLFDHRGRPLGRQVIRLGKNDERIPRVVLAYGLRDFIFGHSCGTPTQVIIHRDGRYLDGETDDILDGLCEISGITLVSIKKDPTTRLLADQMEGACVKLDDQRAVLITNAQANKSGMPAPIEVEVVEPGDRRLGEIVAQIFWMARVCQGNAFYPRRLPATTGWANSIAATGRTLHLKGWEHAVPVQPADG